MCLSALDRASAGLPVKPTFPDSRFKIPESPLRFVSGGDPVSLRVPESVSEKAILKKRISDDPSQKATSNPVQPAFLRRAFAFRFSGSLFRFRFHGRVVLHDP